MARIVEEADSTLTCDLQAPRIGIDGTRQRSEAGVPSNDHLKAEAFERLFEQRNVIVWIGKSAYLVGVCFVSDEQRHTLFGECRRVSQQKADQENY
jgi:hypothetical protein